ncbi:hypothetical protein [Proteiniborus sp. MB09-C3]|uniref:XkdQ/YqbQ family protein n=1 Tax=Proteiniborus sp. MB09-C3 TaxID=3050072 RepID=UPI002552E85F|nr:hypothetical protein [Proteiniborus sp. MB09-C3]WIV11373.1 hypothetical protein QO263_14815 [Proteiniborus sp. MB09-C3]
MMEFLVDIDGKIYEISELVTSISWNDRLNDGCSKLEFSYIDDDLIIENGSTVSFKYNDVKMFYGVVFNVGMNKSKEIKVTAYDQLRYCKAKDTFASGRATVTTLVNRMCNYFGLLKGALNDTKYILATDVYDNMTWLDIIYSAISKTLQNTGRFYALRDEFGAISIRDIEELKLNLILGDESFVYDFDYGKSIDDGFYNLIRIQDKNNAQFIEVEDKKSINRYGLLQYFNVASEKMNASQIKSMADTLLKLYNQEVESLTLKCLGDTRVRAGSSFYGQIEDIELNKRLIVRSATHEFMPVHTMSLEVML